MRVAILELLAKIEYDNELKPENVVSAIFSATADLNAVFPAKIARERSLWAQESIGLMDVRHMEVVGSIPFCIRAIVHAYLPMDRLPQHIYLQGAKDLRPDLH
jgi:chorismate mutase